MTLLELKAAVEKAIRVLGKEADVCDISIVANGNVCDLDRAELKVYTGDVSDVNDTYPHSLMLYS